MTPATRDLLGGVMRHFPSRFNGWLGPEDFELFRVDELLEAEGASV